MDTNETIENVYDELQSLFKNLKAEVLVAEILNNSDLDLENIDILNQSVFSRSYRRDVIDVRRDLTDDDYKIQMDLARNGLYDMLPEGLFHDPIKNKNNESYKQMRQKNKAQEKDARAFFAPFENEFFTQKVFVENNERNLIDKFTNLKNSFLQEFWKIDKNVPPSYTIKLLQLLPYAHKISGNFELTALALENIIGEKVKIEKYNTSYHNISPNGDTPKNLGVDFVLEVEKTPVLYPAIELKIGPVHSKNIDKFIKGSSTQKFISIFCDYFTPLEIDVNTVIEHVNEENEFRLTQNEGPRMGLTTVI